MSVYKHPNSPFFQYTFRLQGHRFHGSTKATNRKDAQQVEREIKAKEKADLELQRRIKSGPPILRYITGRYWDEQGQYHSGSKDTWRDLKRLCEFFGPDKRLDEITDSDVAALVSWRRKHTINCKKKGKDFGTPIRLISPSTVNRSTTEVLKKLFTRAKKTWKYKFDNEPDWSGHWLDEPEEIVREFSDDEANALEDQVRDDYRDWYEFAELTGRRRASTIIEWQHVGQKQIKSPGKGGKWIVTPITPAIAEILQRCRGHHKTWVFTFVVRQPRKGQKKGTRAPITAEGAKTMWRRMKRRASVSGRFHDLRHTTATQALRKTGNLKLVQKLLNHSNISTTSKYAHVLDSDLSDVLSLLADDRKKRRNGESEAA